MFIGNKDHNNYLNVAFSSLMDEQDSNAVFNGHVEGQKLKISDFADELLLKIFENIGNGSELIKCCKVCPKWNVFIKKDKQLNFATLFFSYNTASENYFRYGRIVIDPSLFDNTKKVVETRASALFQELEEFKVATSRNRPLTEESMRLARRYIAHRSIEEVLLLLEKLICENFFHSAYLIDLSLRQMAASESYTSPVLTHRFCQAVKKKDVALSEMVFKDPLYSNADVPVDYEKEVNWENEFAFAVQRGDLVLARESYENIAPNMQGKALSSAANLEFIRQCAVAGRRELVNKHLPYYCIWGYGSEESRLGHVVLETLVNNENFHGRAQWLIEKKYKYLLTVTKCLEVAYEIIDLANIALPLVGQEFTIVDIQNMLVEARGIGYKIKGVGSAFVLVEGFRRLVKAGKDPTALFQRMIQEHDMLKIEASLFAIERYKDSILLGGLDVRQVKNAIFALSNGKKDFLAAPNIDEVYGEIDEQSIKLSGNWYRRLFALVREKEDLLLVAKCVKNHLWNRSSQEKVYQLARYAFTREIMFGLFESGEIAAAKKEIESWLNDTPAYRPFGEELKKMFLENFCELVDLGFLNQAKYIYKILVLNRCHRDLASQDWENALRSLLIKEAKLAEQA